MQKRFIKWQQSGGLNIMNEICNENASKALKLFPSHFGALAELAISVESLGMIIIILYIIIIYSTFYTFSSY